MAKRKHRSKSITLNLTAKSETRRGFTMPTFAKIKSALRLRSKTFLISLIISMLSKLSKTQKISVLIKIDRKSIGRRLRRKTRRKTAKRRTRRKTAKSKTRRKSSRRKTSKRRTKVRA